MRVAVTGGAGFIGRAVVARLADRGDSVVALVRDPAQAQFLERVNVDLAPSGLDDVAAIAAVVSGTDGLIHGAGSYRIGIRAADRAAMWDANVGTTERVIDAAIRVGVPRIVYI